MSEGKRCAKIRCNGELRKIALESSWTVEKYYCSKCGHLYVVPTTLGKTTQVASLVTAGVMLSSFLMTHDSDSFDV